MLQQGAGQSVVLYDPNLNEGFNEDEIDIFALWRIILRYKRMITLIFVLVVATAGALTLLKRPIYTATALLEINTGSRNLVKFQNLESEDVAPGEHLSTQTTILSSQAVAAEVIKRLDLVLDPELGGQIRQRDFRNGLSAILDFFKRSNAEPASEDQLLKSATSRYLSRLSIDPIHNSTLIRVRFDSFDADLSTKIVNEHMKAYIWLSSQRRFDSTSGAKQFLESEIAIVQTRLEDSQKSLTEYARENGVIDTEDRDNIMLDRLTKLNQNLSTAQSARIDAETKYIQSQSVGYGQLSVVTEDGLIKNLRQEQAKLRAEYNELSRIYKSGYPLMEQLQAKINQVESSIQTQANTIVSGLKTNFEQLELREQRLIEELESLKDEMLDLQDRAVAFNILKREFEANKQLYVSLLDRTKEVGVAAGMELNVASVVDAAIPSSDQSLMASLMTSSIFGLVGALGVAFLLALLDNKVNDPEQLRKITRLNYLGIAPAIDIPLLNQQSNYDGLHSESSDEQTQDGGSSFNESASVSQNDELNIGVDDENVRVNLFNTVLHHTPSSNFAEAIQSLRTSLTFVRADGLPKSLMLTSATAGEGKSTLAMNLAISCAKSGKKVVVIDADMRRSRYSEVFEVPASPGLSEYLADNASEKLYNIASISGLSLMVSGHTPNNPVDLLGSQKMRDLINDYKEEYDLVIVDCPPIQGVADAILMSTLVDALVLVVAADTVSQDAVKDSIRRLRMVNAPIIGTVLNYLSSKSTYSIANNPEQAELKKVS